MISDCSKREDTVCCFSHFSFRTYFCVWDLWARWDPPPPLTMTTFAEVRVMCVHVCRSEYGANGHYDNVCYVRMCARTSMPTYTYICTYYWIIVIHKLICRRILWFCPRRGGRGRGVAKVGNCAEQQLETPSGSGISTNLRLFSRNTGTDMSTLFAGKYSAFFVKVPSVDSIRALPLLQKCGALVHKHRGLFCWKPTLFLWGRPLRSLLELWLRCIQVGLFCRKVGILLQTYTRVFCLNVRLFLWERLGGVC